MIEEEAQASKVAPKKASMDTELSEALETGIAKAVKRRLRCKTTVAHLAVPGNEFNSDKEDDSSSEDGSNVSGLTKSDGGSNKSNLDSGSSSSSSSSSSRRSLDPGSHIFHYETLKKIKILGTLQKSQGVDNY